MSDNKPRDKSLSTEVSRFLERVAATPPARTSGRRGRLLFAMDATASREPTWDRACHIQSELFEVTEELGGLSVQLCHYRGFREFHASGWIDDTAALHRCMTAVRCLAGRTQIERLLRHALEETRREAVDAMVFVGDCMEEDLDTLSGLAGELAIKGVPLFVFHEGDERSARLAFEHMARITRGACCPFDAASADQLRDLLGAVAVYAAGGRRALERFGERRGEAVRRLTRQVGGD